VISTSQAVEKQVSSVKEPSAMVEETCVPAEEKKLSELRKKKVTNTSQDVEKQVSAVKEPSQWWR
jgi:hypothetical protein